MLCRSQKRNLLISEPKWVKRLRVFFSELGELRLLDKADT